MDAIFGIMEKMRLMYEMIKKMATEGNWTNLYGCWKI